MSKAKKNESNRFDRFDFEQQIMKCWNIIDELKELNSDSEHVKALILIYESKFEKLWSMFEDLVAAKKIT